tara:strand:- start:1549 stop:2679 length:1131 start_codon:yes stop_codon:yes gene_type:complete
MTDLKPAADLFLTVDLDALAANYRAYQALAHGAEVAGVVKADGYGLGLVPVARALAAAGCTSFFVTNLAEGAALRSLLPDGHIFLTNGLPTGTARATREAGLIPCIGSWPELDEWVAEAGIAKRALPTALHFDTGMNRLGFGTLEKLDMERLENRLETLEIKLVMSHLACADVEGHPLNAVQLERFRAVAARFPKARKSLANSAGVLLGGDYCFDLVRPGYALFGGNPRSSGPSPVVPVVGAYARILQVREVGPDEAAGYGATWKTAEMRRLATLSVGYADGYNWRLGSATGAARVAFGGHVAPVAGRVSMDLLIADVTDIAHEFVVRGGYAELIGPSITLEEVAACAGTIGYEVLTGLGDRYARHYTGKTAPTES